MKKSLLKERLQKLANIPLINEQRGDLSSCEGWYNAYPNIEDQCCVKCTQSQANWNECEPFCMLNCCPCDQHDLETDPEIDDVYSFCHKCYTERDASADGQTWPDQKCECCPEMRLKYECTETAMDAVGWGTDETSPTGNWEDNPMGDEWEIGGICVASYNESFTFNDLDSCEAACEGESNTNCDFFNTESEQNQDLFCYACGSQNNPNFQVTLPSELEWLCDCCPAQTGGGFPFLDPASKSKTDRRGSKLREQKGKGSDTGNKRLRDHLYKFIEKIKNALMGD